MKVKKIFPTIIAAFFLFCGCNKSESVKESVFAMNTYMSFNIYGENAELAAENLKDRMIELDEKWSVTNEKSEIYSINASCGKNVTVSKETADIIAFSLEMAGYTGGAFDPTIYPILSLWGFTTGEYCVPSEKEIANIIEYVDYKNVAVLQNTISVKEGMMIDLGAVGKGFAGDIAIEQLKSNGITSALLDIGGNIQALGCKPDGSDWKVGLKNPTSDGLLGVISISDCAVVTSGNYERYFVADDGTSYGHIIDPETGYPVDTNLLSVTIIGEEGKVCDVLSTALFVKGFDGAVEFYNDYGGFEMILVKSDGTVFVTNGSAAMFEAEAGVAVENIDS